ncbi:hypothetical protein [Actinacidiphila bryophytorum]|uniref:Uncharacterized protein n=1 Tax=Actinacidiphila bryophytorum TaxID=1436133 RepID=A0A9W4MF53_9ACTN|nr:hypothetical protein [Actinacidiphila bryophytorum]MBM9434895.1 hypothetical protein [Actinacidiphila bryophytorum]CAG7641099.1 conserved hypothetical protein [Actinacidiphila bryophytorum]
MPTETAHEDSRLSLWLRVRKYAVPAPMIETATARRQAGDWAGACAAAGLDVDLSPRSVARTHGRELAARVRADLRRLAPDLLRWHMPRVGPDGVLRPGLTIPLARYDTADGPPVHLVARTPPAWADGGQRISLALWDGTWAGPGARHPHRHPHRRFRLDLHRHLWDAERSAELRTRSGADGLGCAADRWAEEAALVLRDEGRTAGAVAVRLGARRRLVLHVGGDSPPPPPVLPLLPDAATWALPDRELLRAGLIGPGALHPLVAAALVPGYEAGTRPPPPDPVEQLRLVDCRGARHRIALVDGVLAPLDHGPAELHRESLLTALGGTPLPCLRAIDTAHRRPDCLPEVRGRLDHGDTAAAVALVEALLGPGASLRDGELATALRSASTRRTAHALYRANLPPPGRALPTRPGLRSGASSAGPST